jgi:hypothetical protein
MSEIKAGRGIVEMGCFGGYHYTSGGKSRYEMKTYELKRVSVSYTKRSKYGTITGSVEYKPKIQDRPVIKSYME